jgi:hypothetical protein
VEGDLLGAAARLPAEQQLVVSYQRAPDSLDVAVPVDFGEPGTAAWHALEGYAACTVQLLGQLKAAFR